MKVVISLTALLLAPLVAIHAADAPAKKPNIVFIYSDDQPVRVMGRIDPYFSTPHLDRLAKESMVFDNAFVTTAICAVSRASFFTGQHSVRHRIASFDTPLSSAQMKQSYAGLLRQAGYRTAFLGKYEESIRVPLMIRDPRMPVGSRGHRGQMVLNIDIAPTIVAMAGLPVPTEMQGIDLSPILRDPKAQGRKDWYYEHDVGSESKGKPLPRCPGARIFHVKDFGAVGDGVTDDFSAIQKAVAAAREAGCAILQFDGSKTYRAIGLSDFTEEALFDLKGAKHLKIEGGGAIVVLHPPDSFMRISGAENIQIDGFRIDYEPKPYYQGLIRKIDTEALTIDIDVPERYPVPEVGKNEFRSPFFGRSFIPDTPGARTGHGDNIYVEEVTRLEDERRLRIKIRENAQSSDNPASSMRPRVSYAAENVATEFVVPHVKYAHRGHVNIITGSARVRLSNLHHYSSPHFWMPITHNIGPITLHNVDLKMPHPETELFVSWRDGLHIKNGRWGILIEDSDWDGAATYDDSFAIYSRSQKMVSIAGNTMTITPTMESKEPFLWRKGDWASVWSPGQRQLRGMARVVAVNEKTGDQTFHVTLESMPLGAAKGDIVLHEESLNRGTVIRNCTTSDIGTEDSSTRFRCVDVKFQNNKFEDFHFWFHAGPNGPRPRGIVMEDNWISDVRGGSIAFQQGLDCLLRGNQLVGVNLGFGDASINMQIEGNRWTKMKEGQPSVKASKGSTVHLGGGN